MVTAAGSEVALRLGEELREGFDGMLNEWLGKLSWGVDLLDGGWGMGGLGLSPDAGSSVGAGVGLSEGAAMTRAKDGGSGIFDTRLDKRSIRKDWLLDGGFRATSVDR